MPEILPKILGIIAKWGRWSEIVAVKLHDMMSGSRPFENILSVRVFELVVTGKPRRVLILFVQSGHPTKSAQII